MTTSLERTLESIVISSFKTSAMILKSIKKKRRIKRKFTLTMIQRGFRKIYKKYTKPEGPSRKKNKPKSGKREKPRSKEDRSDMLTSKKDSSQADLFKEGLKLWMRKFNNRTTKKFKSTKKLSLTTPWLS